MLFKKHHTTPVNASSEYVRFLSPRDIGVINFNMVFAESWTHPNDPITYRQHKAVKCAEVLVPHCVSLPIGEVYKNAKFKLKGYTFTD